MPGYILLSVQEPHIPRPPLNRIAYVPVRISLDVRLCPYCLTVVCKRERVRERVRARVRARVIVIVRVRVSERESATPP